jgi:conjugal transfer mating pair stabilization protein TraN
MGFFIGMPTWVFPATLILDIVGILVVVFMGGCDKEDHITVTLRESGYCHYVDTDCIKRVKIAKLIKICVQHAEFYCCFNSKLARIIHEQGRPQLNTDIRNWGGGKHPHCRGFTPEEFASLDFDKIDLSEYLEDITRNVSKDIESNVLQFFNDAIQTRVSH